MSRPLRIEYPGAWYHVMNRGRRREKIFLSRRDHGSFIKILQETSEAWNLKVSAYCLMPNHYHLLVHTPDGNLSRCMRHVNGVYTQRFNRLHGIDGQLFRGRYKAVLIDSDGHLLEVMRYIHRNPLRAGLTKKLADFPWSSHHGYISRAKKWAWVNKAPLLAMLSTGQSRQRTAYVNFVSQGEPEEIEHFYSMKNLPSVLGSDAFKEWVKDKFSHLCFSEEIPESRQLAPTPEEVIDLVCDHFKLSLEQLVDSRRGKTNLPRDMAIYLVRRYSKETLSGTGCYFGIHNYSTVSSAIERMQSRKGEKNVRKHLEMIEKKINKSQRQT